MSYDVASIYLGASGIKFGDFILGSMCGASLNIFIDGLFGKYLFNPLSWQLWAVVVIRGAVIAMTIIIRTYASKKINSKRQTMRLPLKQTPLFYERRGFLHSSGRLFDHGIK